MAYTAIDNPELYFQAVLWTANGSNPRTITFGGEEDMQPDLLWYKCRSAAVPNILLDSVRGAGNDKELSTNDNEEQGAQSSETDGFISAFTSNGFTLAAGASGGDHYTNEGSRTFVAWGWKAGTTSVPSGSTSDPSAVSYSATAGFGIYKITAPGSGNYALKHGLGTAPDFLWVKDLDANQKHMMWSDRFSNLTDDYLQLNTNDAKATYSTCWSTMNTTDATIATGGTLDVNNDHVIYVFSNRQGFLKHGKYVGNANASGTFVYTGFKPAWLMVKGDRADNWQIMDNKRLGYNVIAPRLEASTSDAEYTNLNNCDFTANGFKVRSSDSHMNYSEDYYYLAFAEAPFVNSNGVPNNAR